MASQVCLSGPVPWRRGIRNDEAEAQEQPECQPEYLLQLHATANSP